MLVENKTTANSSPSETEPFLSQSDTA